MSYTDKTTFWYQLNNFGWWRLLNSWDARAAIIALILFSANRIYDLKIIELDDEIIPQIITIAASIFAVIITALAIIISFAQGAFAKFLRGSGAGEKILFSYWLGSACYVIVLLAGVLYSVLNHCFVNIRYALLSFSTALLIYSLLHTLFLVASTVRFGYFVFKYEAEIDKPAAGTTPKHTE